MAKKVTNEELARIDNKNLEKTNIKYKYDIREDFLRRDEFEDLLARMKYIETKLGIESGK